MLLSVPDVLTAEQVAQARQILEKAEWVDGKVTAGHQSSKAKDNMQVPEGHPAAQRPARESCREPDFGATHRRVSQSSAPVG